jgi:hypothetical protein
LVTCNQTLKNLRSITLSQTIALNFSPHDDLYWSSDGSTKLNLLENLNNDSRFSSVFDYDFMNILKERSKHDYGLRYEIISHANGTASITNSNHSTLTSSISMINHSGCGGNSGNNNNESGGGQNSNNPCSSNSAGGGGGSTINNSTSVATPLFLTLRVNNLIRSDFLYNTKLCDFGPDDYNNSLLFLWYWFENVNRFFEITVPPLTRNTIIDLPPNSRTYLVEWYPTRYCGLKTLLNGD